ncbi:hypothetical protein F5Y05DRAFT_104355 [Hypoxylon sp. FL0543]|nr:hypothetical protein F5Y05DRAFT_104355 [Hypoxylon sp. FL0543]
MNPYETDHSKIPREDPYVGSTYGRYKPSPGDFVPDPPSGPSRDQDVIRYWERVIREKCTEANRMYSVEGWRDVFGLGTVIVKSSHLSAKPLDEDFATRDANHREATLTVGYFLARSNYQVPNVLFQGKINGRDVVVESRIPGVALNVAWPYLTEKQRAEFKAETRRLIKLLNLKTPPPYENRTVPCYALRTGDPVGIGLVSQEEYNILFYAKAPHEDVSEIGFQHNDLDPSNIIVDDDKIVGLIDWETAGYFGIFRASIVHDKMRYKLPYFDDLYKGL